MNVRAITGTVAGIAIWWALFFLISVLIVLIWPISAELQRALFEDGDLSVLPSAMLLVFLLMFIAIGLVSGWVTVSITRDKLHPWLVATPIFLYAAFQHLYTLWDELPVWYNLAVVLFIYPFIIVGGRLKQLPSTRAA